MKEFEHGGDINSFAKELNCSVDEIIDLSSNINFIKPNIQIDFNTISISSYPYYTGLYKAISNHYNVLNSQIELYNGGSSAIFKLFENLNLKRCTIYSPAYLEYKKAAKSFDYKLELINRFEDIYKKPKKNSLVVFVNPSTPDGKYYDLDKLFKIWKNQNCTVFIDESFLDFSKKKSAIKYLKSYDKLYILKSMTKFYSSAGIRIGTIISTKKNTKKLREKEPMWKLSTFDMNYLIEALKDKKFEEITIKKNNQNKKLLIKLLKSYSFIEKVYKSDANFLLIKLKDIKAQEFQKALKKDKIMIRNCSNFDFLDNSYVRVAVKNKKSIKSLKNALNRI